jgi:hypothetical protein
MRAMNPADDTQEENVFAWLSCRRKTEYNVGGEHCRDGLQNEFVKISTFPTEMKASPPRAVSCTYSLMTAIELAGIRI